MSLTLFFIFFKSFAKREREESFYLILLSFLTQSSCPWAMKPLLKVLPQKTSKKCLANFLPSNDFHQYIFFLWQLKKGIFRALRKFPWDNIDCCFSLAFLSSYQGTLVTISHAHKAKSKRANFSLVGPCSNFQLA